MLCGAMKGGGCIEVDMAIIHTGSMCMTVSVDLFNEEVPFNIEVVSGIVLYLLSS